MNQTIAMCVNLEKIKNRSFYEKQFAINFVFHAFFCNFAC